MKKSIRQRVQEFWYKDGDDKSREGKAFSAHHSGASRENSERNEDSSSEFNLDEEADLMIEEKVQLTKKKSIKDGGYRDYSVKKGTLDSMKLIYKSHDQSMAKSKNFARAKMAALNRSKDAALSLNFMRGTTIARKKTDDSNDLPIPENILDDFSLKVPLRTPNLESALIEDMKSMENQEVYSRYRFQLITEKELPEYTGLTRRGSDYLFGTRFSEDEGLFPHSPIGVRNSTSIRLHLSSKESNLNRSTQFAHHGQATNRDRSNRALELPKKKFVGISSVLSKNKAVEKISDSVRGDHEEKGDYSPSSRLPHIHNSGVFTELLPIVLTIGRVAQSIPELVLHLPKRPKHTAKKCSFSFVRDRMHGDLYDSRMSQMDSPSGGDASLSSASPKKHFVNMSHALARLNKTVNTASDNIGWSPVSTEKNMNLLLVDSLDSPVADMDVRNLLINESISASSKKSKAAMNLNRLMNQLRGHCKQTSKDSASPSKMNNTLSSKNSNHKSETREMKARQDIQNIEGFKLHDMALDSDRTVTKTSKNRYTQVINSLTIGGHDHFEEDTSVQTIPDNSGKSSPYALLRDAKVYNLETLEHSLKQKRPRALDLVTDLSTIYLIDAIQSLFEENSLEPFVVN